MSAINQILIALGGNATLLIVLGFLARSLIQTWLAKDVKKFETDLQNTATSQLERLKYDLKSQGDISIEQLKSQLQQAVIEHQVRFSNLHEKRAQIIADLYGRIVEQSVGCQHYVNDLGQLNRQEGFIELEKRFKDLDLFFATRRIYLPEHICNLVENLLRALRGPVVGVFVYSGDYGDRGVDDDVQDAIWKEKRETLTTALEDFEAKIPEAKKVLEDEFRKLLGVENSPSPGRTR
jgi:hypothetical protein